MPNYTTRNDQVYSIWCGRKAHAKKSGIDFGVSWYYLQDLMYAQQERCVLTGLSFAPVRSGLSPFSPSLDRLKPNWGYIEGNLRWVLHGVNDLKGVGTDDDVLTIARAVVAHHGAPGVWGAPPAPLHRPEPHMARAGLREPWRRS